MCRKAWLLTTTFPFPNIKKRDEEKENKVAKIVIKSHAFLLDLRNKICTKLWKVNKNYFKLINNIFLLDLLALSMEGRFKACNILLLFIYVTKNISTEKYCKIGLHWVYNHLMLIKNSHKIWTQHFLYLRVNLKKRFVFQAEKILYIVTIMSCYLSFFARVFFIA